MITATLVAFLWAFTRNVAHIHLVPFPNHWEALAYWTLSGVSNLVFGS